MNSVASDSKIRPDYCITPAESRCDDPSGLTPTLYIPKVDHTRKQLCKDISAQTQVWW